MKARSFPQIHTTYSIQSDVLVKRKWFGLVPGERISLPGSTVHTDDGFFLRNIKVTGNNAQIICRNLPFAFKFPRALEDAARPAQATQTASNTTSANATEATVGAPEIEPTYEPMDPPDPAWRIQSFASPEAQAGYTWLIENTPVCARSMTGAGYQDMRLSEDQRPNRRRYSATFEIERPIDLIWYVVLDFPNIYYWKLGAPLSRPEAVKPKTFSWGDIISGFHGGRIHWCWAHKDEREFKIYGGHGWEFKLTRLAENRTEVRMSKLYYNKPERSLAPLFGKEHPEITSDHGLAKTEADAFRMLCIELGQFVMAHNDEPSVQTWVDSLGIKDVPQWDLPEIVFVRD